MDNNYINSPINTLNVGEKILNVLLNNGINSIKDLWSLNRKQLKKINLSDLEINNIVIKMQLLGLDLNKKVYK